MYIIIFLKIFKNFVMYNFYRLLIKTFKFRSKFMNYNRCGCNNNCNCNQCLFERNCCNRNWDNCGCENRWRFSKGLIEVERVHERS